MFFFYAFPKWNTNYFHFLSFPTFTFYFSKSFSNFQHLYFSLFPIPSPVKWSHPLQWAALLALCTILPCTVGTAVAHPLTIVAHFCTFFFHYWHFCSTSLHYCSISLQFPLLALLRHSFSIVLKVVHWKFPLQKNYFSFEVDLDFDLSQNNIFSTIM